MKNKKPVSEIAAELTEEQKKTVKKLFVINVAAVCVAIAMALVFAFLLGTGTVAKNEAKDQLDDYYERQEMLADKDPLYFLNEENLENPYYDQYMEISGSLLQLSKIMMICGGVLFVIMVIAAVVQSKKYPYYSEKLYFYLKKNG